MNDLHNLLPRHIASLLDRQLRVHPAGDHPGAERPRRPGAHPPVEISATLDDGDTVTLGGYTFTVLHLPGHDPAHIGLFNASTSDEEILLSGDVLFPGGHGTTEIPGADQAVTNATMRRLAAELPATTRVMPGHGAPTTIGAETPWIRLLPGA